MRWYLITKAGEYSFARYTTTARDNFKSHGWRILGSWELQPTDRKLQELIYIDKISTS